MTDVTKTLDTSGMACPMPVVKTRMAITDLQTGDVLQVISTDRGSCTDIPAWAEGTGNRLVEQRTEGDQYVFLIEKS